VEAQLTLFLSAFLAATLLPFYSELLLVGLLAAGHDPLGLWLWASLGNTAGGALNWVLGRYLLHFRDRRWFPLKPEGLHKAQAWFNRYGLWSLLLTWLPAVGDPLTFVAGIMRVRFWLFLLLCGTGKVARYGVLIWLAGPVT
jgi:membrane protein YqaA with SNARE-associated domain